MKNINMAYAVCFGLMILNSCFNLDEEPFSEIIEEDYHSRKQPIGGAAGYRLFRFVSLWTGMVIFDLQEESGMRLSLRHIRMVGDDSGVYKKMHMHAWTNQRDNSNNLVLLL